MRITHAHKILFMLLCLLIMATPIYGFSRFNDLWVRGWFNATNTTILSNLQADNITVANITIANPPVECTAGTYVTFWNGSNSVCVAAMRTTGENVTGDYGFDGNVGIGTTSPGTILDVYGGTTNVNDPIFKVTNTYDNTYVNSMTFFAPNLSTGNQIYMRIGKEDSPRKAAALSYVHLNVGNQFTNRLEFGFHSAPSLLNIQAGGNVGIGTASPDELLHVSGLTTTGGTDPVTLILESTRDSGAWSDNARFAQIDFASADTSGHAGAGTKARISSFVDNESSVGSGGAAGMNFYTTGDTEFGIRMTIDRNGLVGIGTTEPNETLHVAGNALIDGNLTITGTCTSEGADCNADIAELMHTKNSYLNTDCVVTDEHYENSTHNYYNKTVTSCEYDLQGEYYVKVCTDSNKSVEYGDESELCRDVYIPVNLTEGTYEKNVSCLNQSSPWTEIESVLVPKDVSCTIDPSYELTLETGDVVCANPNFNQFIRECQDEYDTSVVGVVNFDPVFTIGDRAPYPVVLKGNVPVKVDCSTPINRGDPLVSSDTDGYAQSAFAKTTQNVTKAFHYSTSVFAKALESCSSGTDVIRVWV